MKKTPNILFIGLFILTACSQTRTVATPPPMATVSPPATSTQIRVLPTPSSPGDSILWENLQVTLNQLETTEDYTTNYGSRRVPPAGNKFLWVHIRLKNTGSIELDMPVLENFSILYAATELKPIYGHRQGHVEYTALGPVISPNQELDGWLRFDIPVAAELGDLRFVFIPESAQVGTSFSSPNYPYADNKPTYVWNCAP
ncbi:MAG TPA: DUF4352 domain-containing protein [Anaerolineales bacterium]|nr:DUF4352 domain-containing protein [Anaerolineales bacterium]